MSLPPASDSVYWFRQCAPYIHDFRGKTIVILLTGETLEVALQSMLLQDIAVLHSLGLRVVVVFGARPQIDRRLQSAGIPSRFHHGMRVTDEATLACVTEAVGRLRTELEARLSLGLVNSPMHGAELRVCSGNFILARPVGVVEGVDLGFTGTVRKVRVDDINRQLQLGQIVLIPTLGYAPTGEVFNLACEDVASSVAIALGSEKLIQFGGERGIHRDGRLERELSLTEALGLIEAVPPDSEASRRLIAACRAVQQGVKRVHVLGYDVDGALLQELFTRDGCGTLISDNDYDLVRQATPADVVAIRALIAPLEAKGILVPRSPEVLEREIDRFIVEDRDGMLVGCASLHYYPAERFVELACLAVDGRYRGTGRGDKILTSAVRLAREAGMTHMFVLTTQTAHWFMERGFRAAEVSDLPLGRQQMYNLQRNSKVFVLDLRLRA